MQVTWRIPGKPARSSLYFFQVEDRTMPFNWSNYRINPINWSQFYWSKFVNPFWSNSTCPFWILPPQSASWSPEVLFLLIVVKMMFGLKHYVSSKTSRCPRGEELPRCVFFVWIQVSKFGGLKGKLLVNCKGKKQKLLVKDKPLFRDDEITAWHGNFSVKEAGFHYISNEPHSISMNHPLLQNNTGCCLCYSLTVAVVVRIKTIKSHHQVNGGMFIQRSIATSSASFCPPPND